MKRSDCSPDRRDELKNKARESSMTCSLLAGSHLNLRRRFAHALNGFLTDQSAKVSIPENKMADKSACTMWEDIAKSGPGIVTNYDL